MFCPHCRTEFVEGVSECVDCGVTLVAEDELPPESQAHKEDLDLVNIVNLTDAGLIGLAKSLLDEADIPSMIRGNGLQDLFGLGRITFNPLIGAVKVLVRRQDAPEARDVLAGIIENAGQDLDT